jgi:hypothetical protein
VILTYSQRQAYWNWCREFIDHVLAAAAGFRRPGSL